MNRIAKVWPNQSVPRAIGIVMCLAGSGPAIGQTLGTQHYEARVGEGGSIELVPMKNAEPLIKYQGQEFRGTQGDNDVYLVKDTEGAVKGVYADPAAALKHLSASGDSVQVFATSKEFEAQRLMQTASVDEDMLDKAAREAAKRLLATVRASACEFDPLPETVSPSVEVSFSFFAGTSLSISATWKTAKICAK